MGTKSEAADHPRSQPQAETLDRRSLLQTGAGFAAAWASGTLGLTAMAEAQQRPEGRLPGQQPDIVVILADDLGNADLGYRGSDIRAPNIDALANGGVHLESFYGMPVCTPARASLMTGRYAMR
jgi:hypothetical protein